MREQTAEEPRTYNEAMLAPQWIQWENAMKGETVLYQKVNTWTLVPRKSATKVVNSGCKTKHNTTSDIEEFKARVVAVGCSQSQGTDYFKDFSLAVMA